MYNLASFYIENRLISKLYYPGKKSKVSREQYSFSILLQHK